MDNNGFSYFLRSGRSSSSAPNAGELQSEQNVEQEQQGTFSGRSMNSCDPENPYLASESKRRRANPGTSTRNATVTNSTIPSPTAQHFPATGGPADPYLGAIDTSQPIAPREPLEDTFAALAAYQLPIFDDDSQHLFDSQLGLGLGLLEGFTAGDLADLAAEDFSDIVLTEPAGNDVLEPLVQPEQLAQPEQSHGESESGVVVPESADSDTLPDIYSGKQCAFEPCDLVIKGVPKSSIEESAEKHFQSSPCKFARLCQKRKEIELLPLSRGTASISQFATMPIPKKSATSRHYIKQSPDESLRKRVKKETEKLTIVRGSDGQRYFVCGYPDCGRAFESNYRLSLHIFSHIRISVYKCTYPECADKPYFRDASDLQRHIHSRHTDKPYHCTLCNRCYRRRESYREHVRGVHKTDP